MASIWNVLQETVAPLFPGVEQNYLSLLVFTLSVAAYGILVYFFYRFVAKRDVFALQVQQYMIDKPTDILGKLRNFLVGVVKYGLVFPLFVFVWFAGFSLLLFFLDKTHSTSQIVLISITLISAIRITTYVRENLAQDLAKTLPLVLLATALIQPEFFSVELANQRADEMVGLLQQSIQFISFSILLEWLLRILLWIKIAMMGDGHKEREE